MANKQKKNMFNSTKGNKKTTARATIHPSEQLRKLMTMPNAGKDVETLLNVPTISGDTKMVPPCWETGCLILEKLNMQLACIPTMDLLGVYPSKRKTYMPIKNIHKC